MPPAALVEPSASNLSQVVLRQSRPAREALETTVRQCISSGMQQKCHFRNLLVHRNRLKVCGKRPGDFPNPLYLPDGQLGPMIQYHRYRGHHVTRVTEPCECRRIVDRPTVFLFRMSGHSTYHLWENNLGPFYSTLQEFRELRPLLNQPSKLLIAFTDDKPTTGPKAPHLLDQLLRSFTDEPLINASLIASPGGGLKGGGEDAVCFRDAVVGISANSFPHMDLLHQMMRNIVGYAPPPPLPPQPNVLFISRNHVSVVRGRKIRNEATLVKALNETVRGATGRPLRYVQMESLSYRDQVALAMHTNIMISPHGGGVANCIWMVKGSVMVEFVAPVGKTLLNMYRAMCGKSGVKHISFLSEPDPADEADPQIALNRRLFSNMRVPIPTAVEFTKKAMKLYADAVVATSAKKQ